MKRLVLASASPRRHALLSQAGFVFDIVAADADETAMPVEDGVALALRLARVKAEAVGLALRGEAVVLGADTVVIAPSGELLGKPADPVDARRMLRLLSGATHQVVTGVCAWSRDRVEVAAALTYVTFLTLSEGEIERYIASGEVWGKAGAYAIQGTAARWVPGIHGDYNNVVGLPVALVHSILNGFGITASSA